MYDCRRNLWYLLLSSVADGVWQIGELERWFRRVRGPIVPPPVQPPAAEGPEELAEGQERLQEGPMAFLWTFFRLAEQILFVFVASLWPNAVALDGMPPDPDIVPPPVPPPDNAGANAAGEGENQEERERELFQDNDAPADVAVGLD